jgi:hypothetical protein
MKRLSLAVVFTAVLLSLSLTPVRAGTIWAPASGTVQTVDFSNLFGGDTSAIFAIFDDADAGLAGAHLVVDPDLNGADTITVADLGGGMYSFTSGDTPNPSITFSGNLFRIGASFDSGATWVADTSISAISAISYNVTYSLGGGPGSLSFEKVLTVIDVTPVPEPSTLLMMALGLAGLMVVRRRAG